MVGKQVCHSNGCLGGGEGELLRGTDGAMENEGDVVEMDDSILVFHWRRLPRDVHVCASNILDGDHCGRS